MDHLIMDPYLQISTDTIGPSMTDRDTDYVYGAWGLYQNLVDNILEFVGSHNVEGYKSICDDGTQGRWIIIQSTNATHIAQGPFRFQEDEVVVNEDNWIIGVTLGRDNWFVEIKGLGKSCFDTFGAGEFWVISKPHAVNEGQSFCEPPTIPFSCTIAAVETDIDPPLGSHILEVKGHISQALVQEDADTMMVDIGTSCEGGTSNEKIVEPELDPLVDFVGDGANLGPIHGNEGLAPWMPITCLEIGHGDPISQLQQDGVHLHDGEFQSLGPLPNNLDTSLDDVYAMFGDLLESDQASHYELELEGQQMAEETMVSIQNLGDNKEPTTKRPWMDEPPCFSLVEVNNDVMEASSIILEPSVGDGVNGDAWTMSKKARMAKPPSPRSIIRSNASRRATSSNEVDSLEIIGSSDNEGIASSLLGGLKETLEGHTLHPLLDQGISSSTESQGVSLLGNLKDISNDRAMEGQLVEGTIATTSSSSKGCKPSKKRSRQPRFKQHGVKRREGGRESYVAYFKPKDLPESDKTFLTIGEFSNERDAWDAFNLFAFVHEGEESCINMEDRDSIEMDAAVWGELPRVDLVAHLRLKGRGYFRSDVLASDSFIPRYRNIKFRKNTQGMDKGKIRWFSDIFLNEGVTDPNVGNGMKHTHTYETAEEAAKEADRLSMLKEGPMAWTNYTITDYMTEVEKDEWDPMWIPLQDNPKKYLSTSKYNSFD